jgi:hypothetical protein
MTALISPVLIEILLDHSTNMLAVERADNATNWSVKFPQKTL